MLKYVDLAKKADSPEAKKVQYELLYNHLGMFQMETMNIAYYTYFRHIIRFLVNVDKDEIARLLPDTVQSHAKFLEFASKLKYPQSGIDEMNEMALNALASTDPKIKENGLKFYHFFYSNHLFYVKPSSINNVIDCLTDENANNRALAFDIVSDFIRV
mmetsp:Transcript_5367/g.4546  ORF Transcript_5367/g.4546 Transcript_5367/m.4546 type:complete len:158 (-) Transcript_5367:363-836(-)